MNRSSKRRRVVVTGIGPVTPVGIGREVFWESLVAGRSGPGEVASFDASEHPVRIAGEVREFDPTAYMDGKAVRHTDRFVHLAAAATELAFEDAGRPRVDPGRAAVFVATGLGGIGTVTEGNLLLLSKGPRRLSPFSVPSIIPNTAPGFIAIARGFAGPNASFAGLGSSGAQAIGEGFRYVRDGLVDLCVAGGTEAPVNPLGLAAFGRLGVLSHNPDPGRAARPFDADRDGFVLAEGGCILILEEAGRARERGATAYAEIVGYGSSADAFHLTEPDPAGLGLVRAMEAALADAGEAAEAVDYVNADGAATRSGDLVETRSIKKALGEHAHRVPVSSTKAATGHMMGAAGAATTATTALALRSGILPPTLNHETPDPECDLDYVPGRARRVDPELALSNSFGLGGDNATLALRRVGDI